MPSFSGPANHLLAAEPFSSLPRPVTPAKERALEQRNVAGRMVRLLLLTLPAIWLGYLMFTYAVDVPYGDQWDGIVPLFVKMRAGTLGFSDFFAFHNEHRIFFPRLLIFPLAKLTHWNIRAEVALIWVLACLCAVNIARLARVTGFAAFQTRMWLLLAANVLLFTPIQWENLIWGFQIGFFLPLVTMTALPWAACAARRPWNFVLTLLLCVVTTFSVASGFCSWLMAAPLLLFCGEKKRTRSETVAWIIWIAVAIASVVVYFHGFQRHDEAMVAGVALHPNHREPLQYPGLLCQFFVAYLGNPFCNGTELDSGALAQATGAILLAVLAATAIYLWRFRKDRQLIVQTLPWFALASITLFNAALTALGRISYGIDGARQSRYVSFAVMLPIALIFLGARIERHWRSRNPEGANRLRLSLASGGAVFATLLFLNAFYSLRVWALFQHDRLAARAVLALRDVVNEPTGISRYVYYDAPKVREWADVLENAGYLRPVRLHSSHLREIARPTDGVKVGELDAFVKEPKGELAVSGWAILLMEARVADSVILAYDKGDGDPIIFARANVWMRRDDVVKRTGESAYRDCGWTLKWNRNDLPAEATRITAWAFDGQSCCAYEIGAVQL